MSVRFRNYTDQAGLTPDYFRVRRFFVERGYAEFTYARWDWMATHSHLDRSAVRKIGLWAQDDQIVAVATFDCWLGEAFCLMLPGYEGLRGEMLRYAQDHLAADGRSGVYISDADAAFQSVAAKLGYVATERKENDAVFYPDETELSLHLPEGFSLTSIKDTPSAYEYGRVLWKGFNHEANGEGPYRYGSQNDDALAAELQNPHVDASLRIAVVAPDGHFASYCGLWYDPEAGYGVVEPMATDPAYRKMGLGRAALHEGIRRVRERGCKRVFVGSSQQFYYSVGFRPCATATLWLRR